MAITTQSSRNEPSRKAVNTTRSAQFSQGSGAMSVPGTDQSAGGSSLKLGYSGRSTAAAPSTMNAGRGNLDSGGVEVHHNDGLASIRTGSTSPSR